MSGVEGGTSCRPRNPLRPPCASPRLEKSYARRRGVRSTTPPAPLSCAMIFLCDLSRRAAPALTSPTCRLGPLLASSRSHKKLIRKLIFLISNCDMTRKRLHDEGVERECLSQPI